MVKMTVVIKAGGNSLSQWCSSASSALLDEHTYFTKHPRLTVSLRIQIHMKPHSLARTEDCVGPMLSWLLNIALYSCELALASGILSNS